jgi:prevent-host-death family protein
MITIGIRELKQQTSEWIRRVRENGEQVQVTYHGKVVAILVPVNPTVDEQLETNIWNDMDSLAAEIGAAWPEGVSASQAVAEQRR